MWGKVASSLLVCKGAPELLKEGALMHIPTGQSCFVTKRCSESLIVKWLQMFGIYTKDHLNLKPSSDYFKPIQFFVMFVVVEQVKMGQTSQRSQFQTSCFEKKLALFGSSQLSLLVISSHWAATRWQEAGMKQTPDCLRTFKLGQQKCTALLLECWACSKHVAISFLLKNVAKSLWMHLNCVRSKSKLLKTPAWNHHLSENIQDKCLELIMTHSYWKLVKIYHHFKIELDQIKLWKWGQLLKWLHKSWGEYDMGNKIMSMTKMQVCKLCTLNS